jgi:hypothetical protein
LKTVKLKILSYYLFDFKCIVIMRIAVLTDF